MNIVKILQMNFKQFQNTNFYKTTFNHMITKHTKKFTSEVLKDVYFRFEYQGLLEGLN